MNIKDVFAALQSQLSLSQYPGRVFRFGWPPLPGPIDIADSLPPGLYLEWSKGRLDWKAASCGGSHLDRGTIDFNALVVLNEQYLTDAVKADYPGFLDNEVLALHMADLADTLIAKVIAINATEPGFFAAPMLPTHTFTKDGKDSAINLMIRVSGIDGFGE